MPFIGFLSKQNFIGKGPSRLECMLINFSATTTINFGPVKIEEGSQKVKVEEGDME